MGAKGGSNSYRQKNIFVLANLKQRRRYLLRIEEIQKMDDVKRIL